uniref:Uncharacterized protein n=1 Tax=Arundo donax TaxID=35708 RepID=A0A0A9CC80_ARUDO
MRSLPGSPAANRAPLLRTPLASCATAAASCRATAHRARSLSRSAAPESTRCALQSLCRAAPPPGKLGLGLG